MNEIACLSVLTSVYVCVRVCPALLTLVLPSPQREVPSFVDHFGCLALLKPLLPPCLSMSAEVANETKSPRTARTAKSISWSQSPYHKHIPSSPALSASQIALYPCHSAPPLKKSWTTPPFADILWRQTVFIGCEKTEIASLLPPPLQCSTPHHPPPVPLLLPPLSHPCNFSSWANSIDNVSCHSSHLTVQLRQGKAIERTGVCIWEKEITKQTTVAITSPGPVWQVVKDSYYRLLGWAAGGRRVLNLAGSISESDPKDKTLSNCIFPMSLIIHSHHLAQCR